MLAFALLNIVHNEDVSNWNDFSRISYYM